MLFSPQIRNQRGIALLYLVILFTLLGVVVSAGVRQFGSTVILGKTKDTKADLERDIQMITAWAIRNGRLPTAAEYAGVFGNTPSDAWSKSIVYVFDNNMTDVTGGGLCGRTGTAISHSTGDVAFFLLSGGDDMTIASTPNASAAFSGALNGLKEEDPHRIVTLDELKSRAGCSGVTQGSLRIINNELPKACKGIGYAATLFADGGVPPVSFAFSGLPTGILGSGAALSGMTTVASGNYPVIVTATDYQAPAFNTRQRTYFLNVTTCN